MPGAARGGHGPPQAIHISNHPDRPYRGGRAFMKEIQIRRVVGAGAMRARHRADRGAGRVARAPGTSARKPSRRRASAAPDLGQAGAGEQARRRRRQAALERVVAAGALSDMADCQLVVEAIVERLDVKRDLFAALEGVVAEGCILASNVLAVHHRHRCGLQAPATRGRLSLLQPGGADEGGGSDRRPAQRAGSRRRAGRAGPTHGPRRCAPRTCPASSSTMPVAA